MTWLDNLRIFSIYAVILLHVCVSVILESNIGTQDWWIGNLYNSAVRWCVPVFVMISGALLLDPRKTETLSMFYKKRCARIMVPILFWSVFFLAWTVLKYTMRGEEVSAMNLTERLLSGKPYYHMWFVYMIMILYLFVPFIRKAIAHLTKQELKALVMLMFSIAMINAAYKNFYSIESTLFINWFLSYMPYFITGHMIRQTSYQPSKAILSATFLISCSVTVLGFYFLTKETNIEVGSYFYDYLSITVAPMSISIMFMLKSWQRPIINQKITQQIASLTLGIYLIHPVILEIMSAKDMGPMAFNPLFSIPLVALAIFTTSLIIIWIMQKIPLLKRAV